MDTEKTIEWYRDSFIIANRERNELQSKVNAYELFLKNMFSGDFNANDFFNYSSSHTVVIDESDFEWVLEHIQKWGQSGMNSAIAYIFNQTPIIPCITEKFNKALSELIERNQKVNGDVDWHMYHYDNDGPYRTINKN